MCLAACAPSGLRQAGGTPSGVCRPAAQVVILNGCGGLLVAATMKYADNIVKCFAAALAIICGMLLSVPIFHLQLNPVFLGGATFTIVATVLYSRAPNLSWAILGEMLPSTLPSTLGSRERASNRELESLCSSSGETSSA